MTGNLRSILAPGSLTVVGAGFSHHGHGGVPGLRERGGHGALRKQARGVYPLRYRRALDLRSRGAGGLSD